MLRAHRTEGAAFGRAQGRAGVPAESQRPRSCCSPSSRGLLLPTARFAMSRTALPSSSKAQAALEARNFTSILEELPGIGPTKRRALLKHLGSLRGVRSASLEALAAVPGVSAADAARIRRFFDAVSAEHSGAETGAS